MARHSRLKGAKGKRSCRDKYPFEPHEIERADTAARQLEARAGWPEGKLQVYPCRHCSKLHIGHDQPAGAGGRRRP